MLIAVLAGFGAGAHGREHSANCCSGLLTGYQYLPFVVVQWVLAALAVSMIAAHGFASLWRTIAWGIAVGACCGLVSAVISYTLFRGSTGGGVTWVTAGLQAAGLPLPVAVAVGSGSTDILDKGLVMVTAGILLRGLPRRILGRFPLASRAIGR